MDVTVIVMTFGCIAVLYIYIYIHIFAIINVYLCIYDVMDVWMVAMT